MNKTLLAIGVVVLAAVAILVLRMGGGAGSSAALDPVDLPWLDDENPQVLVERARGVTLGPDDAPVTIVEFGDYQCPGCAGFAGVVKPQVNLAYVQEGRAKFVFYDFPLISIHRHAFVAARAARCAEDQGRFWEYHDTLFRNQSSWSASPGAPLGMFEDYATDLGLDEADFRGCLRSDRHAELVTANLRLGEALGVGGTPTVMISEGAGMAQRLADTSFDGIRRVMDELQGGEGGQ